MTALDLITSAMRLCGILAQGETPSNDEAQDCFTALNDMVDGWSADRLNIYNVPATVYSLQSGKQTYQIGPGALDFPGVRPIAIQTAAIILPGTSVRFPMDILNSVEWAAVPERLISGSLPRKLYCDYAFPIATLNISPIPTGVPQLELFMWGAIGPFVALTDLIAFPPAYSKALRYNLAVNIAPEFGVPVDPSIAQIAIAEKNIMRGLNAQFLQGAVGQQTTGQIPEVGMPQAPPVPVAA